MPIFYISANNFYFSDLKEKSEREVTKRFEVYKERLATML
jgi:hypothetical protein